MKLLTELNNLVWTNPAKAVAKEKAATTNSPAAAAEAGPQGAVALTMPVADGQHQRQQQQGEQQHANGGDRTTLWAEDELEKIRRTHETQCEKLLTDVYQSTFKVKEYAGLSDNEWYICNIGGHPFFLPFLVKNGGVRSLWKGCKQLLCIKGRLGRKRWKLSKDDVEDMAGSIRRMARLLRMLHLEYMEVSGRVVWGTCKLPIGGEYRHLEWWMK